MATFVLLHGAFRGGWAWRPVAERLRDLGHEVHTPDLLGAAPDHPRRAPVDLTATLDDLEARWCEAGWTDVVLAGHSQGGFVARALSQRVAGDIRLLAYLDAPVPSHGDRAVDLVPATRPGPPATDLDRATWIPPRPLTEDVGLPADDLDDLNARLVPQSVALALEPVVLDDPAALALPEAFAFCSGTPRTFPSWHTRSRLDAEGTPYHVVDAPHDAPLAAPEAVASWLEATVETPAPSGSVTTTDRSATTKELLP